MPLITVFTPTYNRAATIQRVFDSLLTQTMRDFEWLIVDDGSADNTKAVIEKFISQQPFFPVRYHHQQNSGKAIAINKGVELAKGEWFYIADSDDAIVPEALETFMKAWDQIPKRKQEKYSGIVACCKDPCGNRISDPVPNNLYDGNWRDLFYRKKFRKEATNINRLACLKEFPFPHEFSGVNFPEAITWRKMSDKYMIRLISDELRIYYMDSPDSLIFSPKKYRAKALATCAETKDVLENDIQYFYDYPAYFAKMAILHHAYKPFLSGREREVVSLNKNAGIFAVIFKVPGMMLHNWFRRKDGQVLTKKQK